MMQEQFLLWPKKNRRKKDRRTSDRRQFDRRAAFRDATLAQKLRRSYPAEIDMVLEDDEKQLIMDLFRDEP